MNITWIGSPNYDTNRKTIDRIIIHWIVGNLAAADTQFQKASPGTSAHYGIENSEVHQYVKEENVAYHAGVYTMNQRSIGIEHSADPNRPASDETYETSGELIAQISKRHNIPLDREHIIGHKEVKATQCPGTMDIDRLITIAKRKLEPQTDALQVCINDRDMNWNCFVFLCGILGIEVNANDKEATKKRAGEAITELQVKAGQVSSLEKQLSAKDKEREIAVDQAKTTLENQFKIDKDAWDTERTRFNVQVAQLQRRIKEKHAEVAKLPFRDKLKILFNTPLKYEK